VDPPCGRPLGGSRTGAAAGATWHFDALWRLRAVFRAASLIPPILGRPAHCGETFPFAVRSLFAAGVYEHGFLGIPGMQVFLCSSVLPAAIAAGSPDVHRSALKFTLVRICLSFQGPPTPPSLLR
jgi:hypothetical protein